MKLLIRLPNYWVSVIRVGQRLPNWPTQGKAGKFKLPRPLLTSNDLDFSFSGLKTAVLTLANENKINDQELDIQTKADIAYEFQEAVTEVLTTKCMAALRETGLDSLVVSGGVGANSRLRERLNEAAKLKLCHVHYPRLEFCTDNGAMIAFAGALRLNSVRRHHAAQGDHGFTVKPRWDLAELQKP